VHEDVLVKGGAGVGAAVVGEARVGLRLGVGVEEVDLRERRVRSHVVGEERADAGP